MVQVLEAGGMVKRHGDLAMAQHVRAFQTSSLIGRDYGGASDNHNMVIVVAKMCTEGILAPAAEPTGPTASRAAVELTEGAEQAARSLADMLEDQPKHTARRMSFWESCIEKKGELDGSSGQKMTNTYAKTKECEVLREFAKPENSHSSVFVG